MGIVTRVLFSALSQSPAAIKTLGRGLKLFTALALCAGTSGCVSSSAGSNGLYTTAIGNAPVVANPTSYSKALVCLGEEAQRRNLSSPRIAIGRISDYTGKSEIDGGRKITQGASLMAMSALAKAGARQVERFDTSVTELELKYANNKLITDDIPTPGQPANFRKITSGQIAGSDYHIIGGITELNYNIRSSGFDAYGGAVKARNAKGYGTGRTYVMNIGMDLRLINSQTLEVVDVISYQKQIVGREIGGGLFSFFNGNVIDVSAGEGALEPVQLAVRAVIERSVLSFMGNLYGFSPTAGCLTAQDDFIGEGSRSFGLTGGTQLLTTAPPASYVVAQAKEGIPSSPMAPPAAAYGPQQAPMQGPAQGPVQGPAQGPVLTPFTPAQRRYEAPVPTTAPAPYPPQSSPQSDLSNAKSREAPYRWRQPAQPSSADQRNRY